MNLDPSRLLITIPAVLVALVIHEWAHAYTAYRLGDNTAKDQGRLTLNPLKHLDPLGTLLIIIAGFGWAKPVEFDPRNLKKKHRDEILIAMAGPASNLLLAVLFLVLARILYGIDGFGTTDAGVFTVNLLVTWAVINVGLLVFNLIPIPPLDGSHLYMTFVQNKNPFLFAQLYRWGTWGLLAIILVQNFTDITILPISPVIRAITNFFVGLLGF